MPCKHVWSVHMASASTGKTNTKGACGQPYLTPLWGWIHPTLLAHLLSLKNEWEVMHLRTHVIHSRGKPLLLIDDHKKAKSKESYALAKLTFHINPLVPFRPQAATISPATTVLSTNCLPRIKADWKGPTSSSITSHNIFPSTFSMIG